MEKSHVTLTLEDYTQLKRSITYLEDTLLDHKKVTEDTFGIKYQYGQIMAFYTKKELNNEIVKMFDTLQKDIVKLREENTRLKKPFWKRK